MYHNQLKQIEGDKSIRLLLNSEYFSERKKKYQGRLDMPWEVSRVPYIFNNICQATYS